MKNTTGAVFYSATPDLIQSNVSTKAVLQSKHLLKNVEYMC